MDKMVFNKILVVCVGNLCRSPIGESLLKNLLPDKQIASAGLRAVVGSRAEQSARDVAQAHGLNLDYHFAQQLTAELCRDYDLILVMEQIHIDALTEIAPQARGKTMLFTHWRDQHDIPDPYQQKNSLFEYVYQEMEKSAIAWANKLI